MVMLRRKETARSGANGRDTLPLPAQVAPLLARRVGRRILILASYHGIQYDRHV